MTTSGSQPSGGPYEGRKIHFIGAGGCGMSGLAEFVLTEGGQVSGSDRQASAATERLARLGAAIRIGQRAENIPDGTGLVVYSAAIKPDNPEMLEAQHRGIPRQKYAQFLGGLMDLRMGIAVSGTHGKSTTTGMVAYALKRAGLDPSFVIGAEVPQLGRSGSHVGAGPHLVVEACEFDRSFLNFKPHAAVILNVDEDHLDYYTGGLEEIRGAFADFAARVPRDGLLVILGTDLGRREIEAKASCKVETFGIGGQWDWHAENLDETTGCFAFDVYRRGAYTTSVRLALAGRHHVLNALAAIALGTWAGAPAEVIRDALGTFQGASRRMEVLGMAAGVTVVDDYAHHPAEIQATLKAAKDHFGPGRLWVVFQPHQHSRTRFLLKDFARALTVADKIVVPDIYFVRDSEKERQTVSSQDLVGEVQGLGADAVYLKDFDSIRRYLVESLGPGDVLMTMGAGDVWRLAEPLLADLASGAAKGTGPERAAVGRDPTPGAATGEPQ